MIYFHEVQKSVDGQLVLDSLTLHLPKTSYTLVCGEPSSGKTTLLRLIMAYERPDEGTLKVDDLDIGELPDARVPFLRRQIGYIADTPNLLDDRTVAENMAIPLQLAGIDNEVSQQRVADMLARIGLQSISCNQRINSEPAKPGTLRWGNSSTHSASAVSGTSNKRRTTLYA